MLLPGLKIVNKYKTRDVTSHGRHARLRSAKSPYIVDLSLVTCLV